MPTHHPPFKPGVSPTEDEPRWFPDDLIEKYNRASRSVGVRITLTCVSRGDKTPKGETQITRAQQKHRLGAQPSGRNIQPPAKMDYKPTSDGPAMPDPSEILAGETFRSRKPSDWKLRYRRRD